MTTMPRWLELQVEIDYLYFELERAMENVRTPTPIERMIDQAAGYRPALPPEVMSLVEEIKVRRAEYDALTSSGQ